MPDDLSSTLEEIRERPETAAKILVSWKAQIQRARASANDVPRLLAAIEATLELHRPVGDGCAAGGCTWSWPCPTVKTITRELTKGETQ